MVRSMISSLQRKSLPNGRGMVRTLSNFSVSKSVTPSMSTMGGPLRIFFDIDQRDLLVNGRTLRRGSCTKLDFSIDFPRVQNRSFSTQTNASSPRSDRHAAVIEGGTALFVSFTDGHSTFDAPWLWANDPTYFHPSSGQRTRSPTTFFGWKLKDAQVLSARQASLETKDREIIVPIPSPPLGCLHPIGSVYETGLRVQNNESTEIIRVTWVSENGETTKSYYDMDWLWYARYDDEFLGTQKQLTEVRKEQAIRYDGVVRRIDFAKLQSITTRNDARYEILDSLVRDGFSIVQNAPRHITGEDEVVGMIGKSLGGSLSHGQLYGDIFHVQSTRNAHNIAYTSQALGPHQDLAYYLSKPGIQYLHCVNNLGVVGGESLLMDCMAAAHEFQSIAPDLYDILTTYEATFLKQRVGADMVYRRPHIEQDSSGIVAAVHWSPPFEGPLRIKSEYVYDYYVARSAFERMLDSSLPFDKLYLPLSDDKEKALRDYAHEYTWEYRLEQGEVLIFNNQRMLHGRRGFTIDEGNNGENGRHLIGCYTDMDDTMNTYRLLRRERMQDHQEMSFMRNTGNGSSGNI